MWRELISELTRDEQPIGDLLPGPDFYPGATSDELAAVEHALGVPLPDSLQDLLRESNGVEVTFGQHFLWNTDAIVRTNRELRGDAGYRENRMPLDDLLFFGDAGVDGILFAFAIIQGCITREHVYAWYPIDDDRVLKARSLRDYVEGWLSGKLAV